MSNPVNKKNQQSQLERRYLPTSQSGTFEIRKGADGKKKIVGYASKFNVLSSDLGGFREKIDPGAFTANLASSPDVRALWNHDANHILGRTTSGTLRLSVDSDGLQYEIDPPDTSLAKDLIVSMSRGDVTQSSFGFICARDDWQMVGNEIIRTVLEAQLFDVSPVTFPAYPDATSGVRATALRSAPAAILAKLNVRDDSGDCGNGQHFDSDLGDCVDNDSTSDDDLWDTDGSEDFRCSYRCARCRFAQHVHLSNLAEGDPVARSKKIAQTKSNLSHDDLKQEQQRCAYRCSACRSLLSGHFPSALAEDDADARAHQHLLSLRRR